MNGAWRAIVNQGGGVILICCKSNEVPTGVDTPEKALRHTRRERDVKAVQRNLQPITQGLDVCLFARPTIEECWSLRQMWQCAQFGALALGEKSFGDPLTGYRRPNHLHIYAQLSPTSNRIHGPTVRMRKIKIDW